MIRALLMAAAGLAPPPIFAGDYTSLVYGDVTGTTGGLRITTDSASTFTTSLDGATNGNNPTSNIIHAVVSTDGTKVLAVSSDTGDANDGLYISSDSGVTFTHTPPSVSVPTTRGFTSPTVAYINGKFAVVDATNPTHYFWESADGITWTQRGSVGTDPTVKVFGIVELSGDLYISTNVGITKIYKSTDGGDTWTLTAGAGSPIENVVDGYMVSSGTALIFSGGDGVIWRSTDGVSWSSNAITNGGVFGHSMVADENYIMIFDVSGDVYLSYDDGITFTPRSLVSNADSAGFFGASLRDGMVAASDLNGIIYTTNDGQVWSAKGSDPSVDQSFGTVIIQGTIITPFSFNAVSEILTVTTSSPSESFGISAYEGYLYDFVVDWGDGNSDTIVHGSDLSQVHTYALAGSYIVTIAGVLEFFDFLSYESLITGHSQFGDSYFNDLRFRYFGWSNCIFTGTGTPPVTVLNLTDAFNGCTVGDPDISGLVISNITDGTNMMIGTSFSTANYDKALLAWASMSIPTSGTIMDFGTTQYTEVAAHDTLTNAGVILNDGGLL